ncbi:hypothetical protein [Zunongwangia pacifica]|uniref:Lipoprotein n=1 Tax=Zunongwangia pacifica TaxID=2911062 RepID=A0A9X2A085_9FLAO|nr:hypothetical protein [Zunongwangia pacifica]MCL6219686.1 hypothetical protein [Zunongwangia pacifica]
MKYKILFTIIVSVSFFSCKNEPSAEVETEIIPEDPYVVPSDSIPERTEPSALDLKKYQLFIDTTRTSVFYRRLDSAITSEVKKHQNAMFKLVEVKKYNDRFLLYQPCNGNIPRYYIAKGAVTMYGQLENNEFQLKDFVLKAGNRILFKDRDDKTLSLKEINANVLRLKYGNSPAVYVTNIENILQFEMMVNSCLDQKVREFDRFQQ